MTRRRKALAILVAPVVALLAFGVVGYDHARAAAFIVQAAGMDGLAHTVSTWATHTVRVHDTTVPWRGGTLRARVVAGADTSAPPALLVPGVHAGGIDEPRLMEFARDVAGMGRVVLAVELPDLKRYSITPHTTDMIEDAAVWLSTSSGYATDGRVGLMGISFAGGLSVVAASRPSIRDRVAFVLSFGGHGDLPRTLAYLCTGVQPDGATRPPHDYGVAIILLGVADRVVPAEQDAPLREAILAFLHASHVDMFDKPQAEREFQAARGMAAALPEPARTLMGLVNDRDVGRLGPIVLPHVGVMGRNPALSPARSPAPRAPVYLLHGVDDNVIPAVESLLLAGHLRAAGTTVHQLATPLITHAEVDQSAAARAFWDLTRFWANLLDEQ
jgi:dienelactone hydrolase